MLMFNKKVGTVDFNGQIMDVYNTMDEPYFAVDDVAKMLGVLRDDIWTMTRDTEDDERVAYSAFDQSERFSKRHNFISEVGLYNILSQSKKPIARMWRRVVHEQLIATRRQRGLSISDQFDEWDDLLDTIYIDPESGILMQSVTLPGGDVEQIPYKEEP